MRSVPQRTLLSLTGIAIGAAAVVALLNIGENTSNEATQQFKSMGTDLIVIQDGPSFASQHGTRVLKRDDVTELAQQVAGLSLLAPVSNTSVKTGRRGKVIEVTAIGTTDALLATARLHLESGRFISDQDGYGTVAVIGAGLASALSVGGAPLRVGDQIRVDNYLYTVTGLLRRAAGNPLMPFDIDNALIIPIKADRRLAMSTGHISSILIRIDEGQDPARVLADVSAFLSASGSTARAQGAQQLLDGMRAQGQMFKWMLSGVACISLLVGGLGVMNALLASIAERRREIGLHLAIGANQSSIMGMIVIESVLLTLLGGSVGTVFGALLAVLFAWFSNWSPTISWLGVLLGFGMSTVTGLFFGIYPGWKASRLSPIEALRTD